MKLGIISTAVILVIAGGTYYRVDQLQQKRDYFESKLKQLRHAIPNDISIVQTSQSSMFETNLISTVSLKGSDDKLILNTKLNHGIGYLLTGTMRGNSIGKLEGSFSEIFTNVGPLFESKIKILSDNTVVSDTQFTDLSTKSGVHLKSMTSYYKYNDNKKYLDFDFKIGSINIENDKISVFNLKNMLLKYKGSINTLGNNSLGFSIKEVKSPIASMNNLELISDTIVQNKMIDMKTSLKIENIDYEKWKEGSFDFQYSVLGIHQESFEIFYEMAKRKASSQEENIEKDIAEMGKNIKNILMNGMSINVDKFNFKSQKESINFFFKSSLPKVKTIEEVNFKNNFNFAYDLKTKGNISNILAKEINKKLNSLNHEEQQILVNNDELHINFDITKGKATLNNKPVSIERQEIINSVLSTLDEKFQEN